MKTARRMTGKTIIAMVLSVIIICSGPITQTNAAETPEYWIKVNAEANVVNIYEKEDGEWTIQKAMVCSCGIENESCETPVGEYTVKKKWRWQQLFGGAYGQYATQFYGNYLFHTVPYKKNEDPTSCMRGAYSYLGQNASQGCVRLMVGDAKWIYENCPEGTRVTVYKDDFPGPLGKPDPVPMEGEGEYGIDPTDLEGGGTFERKIKPVIEVEGRLTIKRGEKFRIKDIASAKDEYSLEDMTAGFSIEDVEYRKDAETPIIEVPQNTIDTNAAGEYKFTLKFKNRYNGEETVYENIRLTVTN